MPRAKELTDAEKQFAREYLVDFNKTQAAIRAGFSEKRADDTGYKLARKPEIRQEIDRLIAKRCERIEVKREAVIRELSRIAYSDIRDFVEWGPDGVQIKSSKDLQPGLSACVQEVSQTKYGVRIKLYQKTDALVKLAQQVGLLNDPTPLEELLGRIPAEFARAVIGALAAAAGDRDPAPAGSEAEGGNFARLPGPASEPEEPGCILD